MDEPEDLGLVNLSLQVTVGITILTVATFALAPRLDLVFAIVSAIAFFIGTAILGLGIWNGIQRSKLEEVRLTGLLAVDTSHVPKSPRNKLWFAIVVQIVVTFAFAAVREFTQQAFGVLLPMLGLGFAALWGSRFAKFHPRDERR